MALLFSQQQQLLLLLFYVCMPAHGHWFSYFRSSSCCCCFIFIRMFMHAGIHMHGCIVRSKGRFLTPISPPLPPSRPLPTIVRK